MFKFMMIFRNPANIERFEEHYNTLLAKVEKMPAITRRQVFHVVGSPTGATPYYRILEIYFEDRRNMELSLMTPVGQEAGEQLANFPSGSYELIFGDVYEEAGNWPPASENRSE